MEISIFIEKFVRYLRANGVEAQPEVKTDDGAPVPGYVPRQYLEWLNPGWMPHYQNVELLMATNDGGKRLALFEVQRMYGLPEAEKVTWAGLDAPPPAPGPHPVIGKPINNKPGFYVNNSSIFHDGATYEEGGARYVLRRIGLFGCQWERVA